MIAWVLLVLATQALPAQAWPLVGKISKTFAIRAGAERIEIDLPIRDRTGAPLYSFWCRGGEDSFLDHLGSQLGIEIVGPLVCALDQQQPYAEESLLSEDERPYWYSRGQFHW